MKRKRLTVMWMSSASSDHRIFSISHAVFYICIGLIVISWLLLGMGAYLGNRLYHDSLTLQEQNSRLLGEVKDLDSIRLIIKHLQNDESIIRSFLGLDKGLEEEESFGQGGEPSPDLSTVVVNDVVSTSRIQLPKPETHSTSIAKKAMALQADLQELVEAMRDQKQVLDSTPSILPLQTDEYWLSSGFGWRRSPFTGLKEFHNGLDICSRRGTPIIAPATGVVYRRGNHRYLGKYIRINHGKGVTTTYGHLSGYNVSRGQKVKRGEVIGFMGNSGRSLGTHLHYTVRVKNRCVNPLHYILNTKNNRLVQVPLQVAGGG